MDKSGGRLGFEGQIKVFLPKKLEINFSTQNPTETINRTFMCDQTIEKTGRGFLYMLAAILCFANFKVKRAKYRILSDRFEISTPKLCKNM